MTTDLLEPDYYVCNTCAHTWGTPEADRCENCGSESLAVYSDHSEAEKHSQTVLDELTIDAAEGEGRR